MKICLECHDSFLGREDKKFCCDGCRNSHNNKINRDKTNLMRNINNKLRKNYRILSEVNPKSKSKVSKSVLIDKGFDFEYFTSLYTTKSGETFYLLYDLGYKNLENNRCLIFKKEN